MVPGLAAVMSGLMGSEWPKTGHSGAMKGFMSSEWPESGHSTAMSRATVTSDLMGSG